MSLNPDYVKNSLKDRHVILKYKAGGRIKEERVYNSADGDDESLLAVCGILNLAYDKPFDTQMIGKGYTGSLPWQSVLDLSNPPTPQEKLEHTTPIRIADVFTDAMGIIHITIESV